MTRTLLVEAAEEEEEEVGGTVVMLPRCLQQLALTVSLVAVETALMPRHQYTA